jgi:hypothetical protein
MFVMPDLIRHPSGRRALALRQGGQARPKACTVLRKDLATKRPDGCRVKPGMTNLGLGERIV